MAAVNTVRADERALFNGRAAGVVAADAEAIAIKDLDSFIEMMCSQEISKFRNVDGVLGLSCVCQPFATDDDYETAKKAYAEKYCTDPHKSCLDAIFRKYCPR